MPENQVALGVPDVPEVDLLLALAGDQAAVRRLHAKYSPLLYRAAAWRIRSLPEDLYEEVVQEVWLLLFQRYGMGRKLVTQSAKDVLFSLLGHAVDAVRAAYRAPGQRARSRNVGPAAARTLAGVELALSIDTTEAVEGAALTRAERSYAQVEARHDLAVVMRSVPRDIGVVFEVMLDLDISMSAAVLKTGITRSRLQRWVASVRQVAA